MPTRTRRSQVQAEIRQRRAFRSLGQEVTIALLRTASVVGRGLERVVLPEGISLAQYNALRIIRGSEPDGIASLAIRDRMIEQGTTITRLLDKLEAAGLVARRRGADDRRLVLCHLTAKGRSLLERLDPRVDEADRAAAAALARDEQLALIGLLDRVRRHNAARGVPRHRRSRGAPE